MAPVSIAMVDLFLQLFWFVLPSVFPTLYATVL